MLSHTSWVFILKSLNKAHATYQSPILWNPKRNHLELDESKRHYRLTWAILLLDIFNFLSLLTIATFNYVLRLNYAFTLFMFFLMGLAIENIVLDINSIRLRSELLHFVTHFLRLLHSRQGKLEMLIF